METVNPFAARLAAFQKTLKRHRIDLAVVRDQANVRALTGVDCDNAILAVAPDSVLFHTDFRYIPMVHRVAPWVKVKDIKKFDPCALCAKPGSKGKTRQLRIGYESNMTVARFEALKKKLPDSKNKAKGTKFIDILGEIQSLRSVKNDAEIEALRAAAKLNDEIWDEARGLFAPGMSEREMACIIKTLMIKHGDGEAFETIVCVGKNAAECHHVPDGTVWDGKEPVLVDMGVKLNGYCSDMTRNIVPRSAGKRYREIYDCVLAANMEAIKAAKPGMTAGALDKVARDYLKKHGFGKEFGHSLGHGVGIEIHEAPWIAAKQKTVLKAGMAHSIEPGVYLEGELGVRIEDVVLLTETGCEVLSHSKK